MIGEGSVHSLAAAQTFGTVQYSARALSAPSQAHALILSLTSSLSRVNPFMLLNSVEQVTLISTPPTHQHMHHIVILPCIVLQQVAQQLDLNHCLLLEVLLVADHLDGDRAAAAEVMAPHHLRGGRWERKKSKWAWRGVQRCQKM